MLLDNLPQYSFAVKVFVVWGFLFNVNSSGFNQLRRLDCRVNVSAAGWPPTALPWFVISLLRVNKKTTQVKIKKKNSLQFYKYTLETIQGGAWSYSRN